MWYGDMQTGNWPKYQCHKVVEAVKLSGFQRNPNGSIDLFPENGSISPVNTENPDWIARFKGTEDDPGYLVRYEDGFLSWSPSDAFESGYSAMQSHG